MKVKLLYALFGAIPALVLSFLGLVYLFVLLSSGSSLDSTMLFVLWPLSGVVGTISGCLVLLGVGLKRRRARGTHIALLCLGMAAAGLLAGILFPEPAALIPAVLVLVGVQLLRIVFAASAQHAVPSRVHACSSIGHFARALSRVLYPLLRCCRNLLLKILGKTKINNLQVDRNDRF